MYGLLATDVRINCSPIKAYHMRQILGTELSHTSDPTQVRLSAAAGLLLFAGVRPGPRNVFGCANGHHVVIYVKGWIQNLDTAKSLI